MEAIEIVNEGSNESISNKLLVDEAKKKYKISGYILFVMALGLAVLRTVVYFVADFLIKGDGSYKDDLIIDLFFSPLMQLGINLIVVFLLAKLLGKKSFGQTIKESNFRGTVWWFFPLSFAIGIAAFIFTMGASSAWAVIISIFGYTYTGSAAYPNSFSMEVFLLTLFLSAVLPAVCEEHATRGYVLNGLRGCFDTKTVMFISAVIFGLSHQYITQVFYAAIFGAFLAYLTIKTGSIFPAVIIHFTNNTMSTLMGYADNYGWGSNLVQKFDNLLQKSGLLAIVGLIVVGGGLVAILSYPIFVKCKKKNLELKIAPAYKPTVRDSAFHIGALALTLVATLFTFAFNWY